jgi:hypothetical protein
MTGIVGRGRVGNPFSVPVGVKVEITMMMILLLLLWWWSK